MKTSAFLGVVAGLGIRAGKSLHNDALCKPEGRGKRNRTGEVPIMPALSEREPKVRLRRRFSKNKIGRGTLFYFCDSLFPSCRRAPDVSWALILAREKGKTLSPSPVSPTISSGKVRTFSPLFTAIP